MKILAVWLLLSSLAVAQSFHQINITWTNPNSAANAWPNCNFASGPKNVCVEGFTLSDVTNPQAPVVIAPTCTATVTTGCLSPLATSFIIAPLPPAGNYTYALIANGLGAAGTPANSTAVTVSVGVPSPSPDFPHALSVTLQ